MKANFLIVTVFIVLFTSFSNGFAQQDSQYTQYMYNTMSVNPAYAGNRGSLMAFGLYRNQWVGLEGAPETINFAVNSPVGVKGVGLGLSFFSDKIGPSTENNITASFSYTLQLNDRGTQLSFGINGGVNILDLDVSKLTIYDPSDVNFVSRTTTSPVAGAGFYLHDTNWYVGLSTPNLLETDHYDDVAVSTATEKMHMYFIAGYVFDLNPSLKFKPSLLTKVVPGAPTAVDLSANFLIYEKLSLGAAYRWDASLSGLAGFQITDQLLIGYAYDYETTDLSKYNNGSHEVFLRFELGTRVQSKVNPRFF